MAKENTSSCETDTWDQNGSEKTVTIYGNLYSFTYDDEDRLTKMVTPSATDTYTYNGLGLRVGKTDSTGSYLYVCDGTTPGSPVLADGHALHTPGLSENRGGTSVYYDFDRLGNLWTADGTGKSQYAAVDYSAFGITLSGSAGTPFGYGGANGCQTDLDASLVLMGHRYFDPRTGRFISQDPAGSGDNWYAYADNNPVNETDPLGLFDTTGMNFTQIYNEADREGGTGSVWNNTDANGYTSQFTVTTNGDWGTIGGVTMHIPNGEDIGRNIGAARQFMASKDSHSQYSLSRNGYGPKVSRHDPKKVKAWLVAHVGNDGVWDYKHRSKDLSRYDEAGHVNYAAVASELRIDLTTIIVAQQVVHEQKYGLTAMPEGSSGEVLGYHYDQQTYNPGPALFSLADMWP